MSALTDAVTALKTSVDANTTAVAGVPNSSDEASAVVAINAATTQITANTTTLTGDETPAA